MMIACLGWGSLVWDPRDLPLAGEWRADGPSLPLEFARQSQDGRMTLVIVDHDDRTPVLWAPLNSSSINEAVVSLADREGTNTRSIGRSDTVLNLPCRDIIRNWATEKGASGVVWTALEPGLVGQRGRCPSYDEIVDHIQALAPDARANAAKYLKMAPKQIVTPYRKSLELALNIT